jgi:hypothetical protein
MKRQLSFFLLLIVVTLFSFSNTANATTIQSAYKIGVAQFTNSSEFGNAPQFIVDTFVSELPKSLNIRAWKIKDDIVFSNKDNIINAGALNGVDTILTGNIAEYTVKKDVWLGGVYAKVRVEANLYSAKTGELIWTGTVTERYAGDTEIHCLQKATRETVWSLKKAMITAGLQGRPNDSEKPSFEILDQCLSSTSVYFLEGYVKDNFGVARLIVNGQATPFTNDGKFSFMLPMKSSTVIVDIKAEDDAGNIASKQVQVKKAGSLDGKIAQIIGNKIFINKGLSDNVKEGMGFTVSTVQQIKDPSTGDILDSVTTDVGIIRVIDVKDRLSIAELVTALNAGRINVGDYIY